MTEGKYRLDLDKIPMTLATLSQIGVMCGFHERFSWISIPRNLCSCTRSIGVLFIKMFNSEESIWLQSVKDSGNSTFLQKGQLC